MTYFLAVICVSWFLGYWCGISATLLSVFAAALVIVPHLNLSPANIKFFFAGSVLFLLEGIAISALGQAQLDARSMAEHIAAEAQIRADREAFVNRIVREMRSTLDPDLMQEKVVTMLGNYLGVDRCYFAIYNLENGFVTIGRDWRLPHLSSVQGLHQFPNTAEMFNELYPRNEASVVNDRDDSGLSEQTKNNMLSLNLKSRVSVAVADTKGMATLTAAMSQHAREWNSEDIQLLEMVAAHLRPSLEMARVQQREHRIATDLQSALLPALPRFIPGLHLCCSVQPALDEAEVGGDFYDVFSLDKNLYALVIGDVSGKGLAAAAQLATVRNSLRMSLYMNSNPAQALSTVNEVLTAHSLLPGFVTVFVAVYDAMLGTIDYASAGHEPPLLRRASTNTVEALYAAGMPIGVNENAEFAMGTFRLETGDAVLFYTDGLSEAGSSRTNLFGIEGIIALLNKSAQFEDDGFEAERIVDDVKRLTGVPFRDDVCTLFVIRVDDPGLKYQD